MSTPTEYQKIEYGGKPAYVLVPWEDWDRIRPLLDAQEATASGIPQEVVEAHILRNDSIVKAWREYLGITQTEMAKRLGMSQAAVVKFERPNARLRMATIKKIASAFGIGRRTFEGLKIFHRGLHPWLPVVLWRARLRFSNAFHGIHTLHRSSICGQES